MRAREVRDLGESDLLQKEKDLREELFRLRLRAATGQMENVMRARIARRDLARILTEKNSRKAATAASAD